jgi:uncharacterized membrane protein YhiD involved in acid resistance
VGALSIVRFRTAIKDPEELLYLFLAIAIGVGLGADQRVSTVIAVGVVMVLLVVVRLVAPRNKRRNLYLNIQLRDGTRNETDTFEVLNELLAKHVSNVDMRRLDRHDHTLQLTYLLDCSDQEVLARLMDELTEVVPECDFTFVDQNSMPGS